MSDARWQQVKALFQATLERPPAERAAFVAAATGGDDALRREIESLLDSDGSAAGFTDRLPGRDVSPMMGSPPRGSPRAMPSTLERRSPRPGTWARTASPRCSEQAGWGRCSARTTAR